MKFSRMVMLCGLCFLGLLLCDFASAAVCPSNNASCGLKYLYTFNNTDHVGAKYIDLMRRANYTFSTGITAGASGKLGECIKGDNTAGADGKVSLNLNNTQGSITAWINISVGDNDQFMYRDLNNIALYWGGGTFTINNGNGASWDTSSNYAYTPNKFMLFTITWNSATGRLKMWINNSCVVNNSKTKFPSSGPTDMYIGSDDAGPGSSKVDEWAFYNYELNVSQITWLWNNNNGRKRSNYSYSPPPPASSVVSWDGYPPPSGDHQSNLSRQYFYNLSGVGARYCEVLNNTKALVNSSVSQVVNKKLNLTLSALAEGTYSLRVSCVNGSRYNSSIKTLFVDRTTPNIVQNPSSFLYGVSSVGLGKHQRARLNFSFSDDTLLYAYQFVFYNNSKVLLNFTNTSITGTTYLFQRVVNVSTRPGLYHLNVSLWDAHTAHSIPDYAVKTTADSLDFGSGLVLSAVGAKGSYATKGLDRYSLSFSFVEKGEKVFFVRAPELDYLPVSPFPGHFVDWSSKRWIDFDCGGQKPVVEKMSDGSYQVTFVDLPADVSCHSVGGLNYRSVVYNYTVPALPVLTWTRLIYYIPVGNVTTVSLSITGSFQNQTTFKLYNASKTLVDTTLKKYVVNGSLWVNVSYAALSGSVYYVNASHKTLLNDTVKVGFAQLSRLIFNNCSLYHNKSIEFSVFREDVPAVPNSVTATITGKYWETNPSLSSNFSYVWVNASVFSMCLFPAGAHFFADLTVEHKSVGNVTNRYYLNNLSLSNDSRAYSLYSWLSSDGLEGFAGTVRNKVSYAYSSGVYAGLQKFYPAEGLWRLVQMDKSGQFGEVYFNIVPNVPEYRVSFIDHENHVLATTSTVKFICDNVNIRCEGTFLVTPYSLSLQNNLPVVRFYYSNTTRLMTFYFNGTVNHNISMRVIRRGNDAAVCEKNVFGSSGSYVCNMSGYFGTFGGYISAEDYLLSSITVNQVETNLGSLLGDKESAALSFLIMLVCACMGFFSPVASVLFSVIGLIAVASLGFAVYITVPVMIVAVLLAIVVGIKVRG